MSFNGNTDKAVSLLREAASLLAGDRESDDTAVSTAGRVVTGTETVVTNSVSSSSHDQNRVLQNFRSLFSGYRTTNPGTSTFPKRSESKSFPPAKRSRSSHGGGYYRVRETWTREFVSLRGRRFKREGKGSFLAPKTPFPFPFKTPATQARNSYVWRTKIVNQYQLRRLN